MCTVYDYCQYCDKCKGNKEDCVIEKLNQRGDDDE